MRFHNRAIDQVQTVARFCRQRIENTLPDSSPRPAVEPIVRACVRAVAFGQIAPRNPGPQHVKYCIYDPPVVRARALPTLRHQRLEKGPFLIAEIESHDPPPPAVNHDPGCFSVNYAGTRDPGSLPLAAGPHVGGAPLPKGGSFLGHGHSRSGRGQCRCAPVLILESILLNFVVKIVLHRILPRGLATRHVSLTPHSMKN